ncbi:glycoside hydrolase family 97 protein [Rubrolithibacter danxiaensis]|uniref:glycoside hydrolase family 97 protein n=1 Tax=Rubrolithibacter danxiaensis TaxID=3390805 RepID=UPI003BF7ACF3
MKNLFTLLLSIFYLSLYAEGSVSSAKVKSPDGNLEVVFNLKNGIPYYSLNRKGITVIKESRLGFILKNNPPLDKNFKIAGIKQSSFDETWKPVLGEVKSIRNNYKKLKIELEELGDLKRKLTIIFNVYNEGIGFRYEFPIQPNLKYFVVSEELTEFNLTGDHKAFWIPGDYDSNEYPYTTSKLSQVDAWKLPPISYGNKIDNIPDQYAIQTPLMLKTANGLYINIHEAALVNYSSMQLHVNRQNYSLSARLVPDAVGNKVYLRTPVKTPWRTIIVSDKATEILASKLILNLNEPSKIEDTSWIKPVKFMGVWWEMQTGKSSWNYSNNIDSLSSKGTLIPNGRHGANTANVKRYIDFADKNGITTLLVEGWNTGWEEWTGNWKEENFDFVSPYPDFDVEEITNYAKQKGIEMIMHNETGGSASNYERLMDTAFRMMNKYGYKSLKTGYVGQIIPRGEHHDGQWMINHYSRGAEKAAQYKVMIDMHEPVRPTGLNRTYPNWLANEAGRGNEWNAFSEGNAPDHETILPFTRLIGGPMDYTPGIFKLKNYAENAAGRQVHTTLAKQLALYVTIYSPLQMAADLPENYEAHPDAFQFIKDVALDWDDTQILEAEPGDYITIARKEKGAENWFVGAITDENARISNIRLDFLTKGKKYIATIYRDAESADWKTNPEAFKIETFLVDGSTKLKLKLASGGGAAISLTPATTSDLKSLKKYK